MKRLIIYLTLIIGAVISASAQKGLAINQLFDGRYRKDPKAVETTVRGRVLDGYDISLYRSISIADRQTDAEAIEALINTDSSLAIDSEVSSREGHLYYAFYRLRSNGDCNRYVLYINQHLNGGNKIVLMYIEGEASLGEIKKMFNHK